MPDLSMSVRITRYSLGLPYLELNDHLNYYASGDQFMGGNVTYSRQQVGSPFVDGQVTVYRTRQMVNESLTIEVLSDNQTDLKNNIDVLTTAMTQDNFYLYVNLSGAEFQYRCEAADYQLNWNGPRWISNQVQMVFTLPRQPYAYRGVV